MRLCQDAFGSAQCEKLQSGASIVTLGNFDGVHVGHRQLIAEAAKSAKNRNLPMAVVTFDPHPTKILCPERPCRLLMALSQKLSIFEALGADMVWVIPLDNEFSEYGPEAFLNGLREKLSPTALHVGRAFRFGKNRLGDVPGLQIWGSGIGCEVHAHAFEAPDGGALSSSRIRQVLMDGNVELASELLGAPFQLTGAVVQGERRGKMLGFPTANLAWDQELLPAQGVYATAVQCPPRLPGPALGLTNVGMKPTFNGQKITVETHLPGIDADLYGARMEVGFLHRIRGEEKFEGFNQLKAQIADDIKKGISWWKPKF
jgi:riboflavin kinase/FMN adenylyltransferase